MFSEADNATGWRDDRPKSLVVRWEFNEGMVITLDGGSDYPEPSHPAHLSANQQNETSATRTPVEDTATKKVSNLEAAQAGRHFAKKDFFT